LTDTLKLEPRDTFESRELYVKAEANIKRNNYGEALGLLEQAIKISPEHPVYLSTMGLCEAMMGDAARGEKMCRSALRLAGKERDPMLYVNLGRVLLETGDRQAARDSFMKAYRIDNTNAPAALELSRMGVRKKPVLPFLSRNHFLNVRLGKLRHQMMAARVGDLKHKK
jgi:tetratricopeptide (TPR) repeat protein